MRSELRLAAHLNRHGENAVEIWYNGALIGTVYGYDGPGVRVVSKYQLVAEANNGGVHPLSDASIQVLLAPREANRV